MNGLAKASGIFSIVAGLIFIVAVVLGVMDGLSFTADSLESFEAVKKFRYVSLFAGIFAALAGYLAVTNGSSKKNPAFSVYGACLILLGAIIAISANKGNMNSLSYDFMVTLLTAAAVAVACAFGLGCAKERNYAFADVAIILAFAVVAVFALNLKILVPVIEMVVVIVLGALQFIVKPKPAPVVESKPEAEPAAEEERKVVPAAAAVPAAPPVAKPVEEEAAEDEAAEEKPAAPAAAEKKAEPAPAKAAEPAPAQEAAASAAPAVASGAAAAGAAETAPAAAAAGAAVGAAAVAAAAASESSADDESGLSDEDLGLIPDTPSGFVRRACWNKGLRCRKDYGPYFIHFAFVKSKVAVYIDGDTADTSNDAALQEDSWIVLHFKEADITDGQKEAEVVNDAVKENTRALKKAKAKKKR